MLSCARKTRGAKALAETLLSSGGSKHIDMRYHFIRELVGTRKIKVVHVDSAGQHADIWTESPSINMFVRHRPILMKLGGDE